MNRGSRVAACILFGFAVVSVLGWLGLIWIIGIIGDRFYVVDGTARLRPASLDAAVLPAIVCVGNGGPLETSGVYAVPLGFDNEPRHVRALCRRPAQELRFPFRTDVFGNAKPRRMHAYVWLESHPELRNACSGVSTDLLDVSADSLTGYGDQSPTPRACDKPQPGAVLGYAVAFEDLSSEDKEHADVELLPKGYPSSRVNAR